MCGLAGAILFGPEARITATRAVDSMCTAMLARGPDAVGHWIDEQVGAALGLRRLAIIDLDRRADQPMVDELGRFVIVFNGEIYNYEELRSSLQRQGETFRTTSDTEVLLKLYAREGPGMLSRLRGMYAIAIWDRLKKSAFLARDPYGIKPLYIARSARGVLFASQVRALLATGCVSSTPDATGQAGFWLLGSVPEPHTWYRDIEALPAGSHALISQSGRIQKKQGIDLAPLWHRKGAALSHADIQDVVNEGLRSSVRSHLVADVPVGVFLSGGIDSGALAALMVEAGGAEIQGVTLAFKEFEGRAEDEVPDARKIAAHYGIRHTVRTVTRREFEDDLPKILSAMDQPTVDGINTWFASKAIAELGLKVVISGVGGDELFQGYSTFDSLPTAVRLSRLLSVVPGALSLGSTLFGHVARRTGNARWTLLPQLMQTIEGAWFVRRGLFGPDELPSLMGKDAADEALRCFHPVAMVQDLSGPLPCDLRLRLSQIESMAYLRNQLLRDSDWASMAHGVELRTPLVDYTLLTHLAPVLPAFKRFHHKRLLAKSPTRPLPDAIMRRTKTGFGIPVQKWLVEMGLARNTDGMSRGWARILANRVYALG